MQGFLGQHKGRIVGVLLGFDRLLFRGTLRSISYLTGMDKFLNVHGVLYKHFGRFAERVSDKVKEHARQFAEKHERPFHYLQSSSLSKEDYARTIMEQDGIRRGLVCVLSCVEPCQTYALRKDRESKRLVLTPARRKCLFLYFYFVDREFGLMHVRLQTWLPMSIQVCLNGREYLANRLDKAGIGYEKRGNCFTRIDDLPRAQQMMNDLERRNWAHFLSAFARRLNPWLDGPALSEKTAHRPTNGEKCGADAFLPIRAANLCGPPPETLEFLATALENPTRTKMPRKRKAAARLSSFM